MSDELLMDLADCGSPEKLLAVILKHHPGWTAPVPIEELATAVNIVEFRELDVPEAFYPPGGSRRESWRSLFYANLIHSFISEILSDSVENEGNFEDGAHVQELINAVELSCRERRWVTLPLAQ